jgi:glycerophosphoryl diester phosphodiesterase
MLNIKVLLFLLLLNLGCNKKNDLQNIDLTPTINYLDEGEDIVFTSSSKIKSVSISFNDSLLSVFKIGSDTFRLKRKNVYYNKFFKIVYYKNNSLFLDSIQYKNDLSMLLSSNRKFIAHRGYSSVFPENTGISIINAAINGMPYFDCDFWLTKDKKWVAIHDETIDRTSNSIGKVSDFTFDDLSKLNFGYPKQFGTKFNEKILLLDSVIKICKLYKIIPFLEIKDKNCTKDDLLVFLNKVNSNFKHSEYFINSFILDILINIRKIDTKTILGLNSQGFKKSESDFLKISYPTIYSYPKLDFQNSNLKILYNDGTPIFIYTEDNIDMIKVYSDLNYFTYTNIIPFKLF